MKRKSLLLLILSISFFLFGCSNSGALNKELSKMADNLNKAAPAQLDDNTLFLGAQVSSDNTFKYLYQIINTEDAEEIMDEMEAQTRANIKEAFRINPDLKIFTVNDVDIEYIYQDSLGRVVRTILITPKDYK